jgi:hypothetical protein
LGWLKGYRRRKEIWLFLLITDQCVHLLWLLQARKLGRRNEEFWGTRILIVMESIPWKSITNCLHWNNSKGKRDIRGAATATDSIYLGRSCAKRL